MSGTQRSKLITKLQSSLKKHYSLPPATPSRPLLEHALYASLLEDCPSDLADEGLVKLEQDYFDWNEVRVTTVSELKGVLSSLPDAAKTAQRLKSNLQSIFEEFYTFDLDHLKKENLGKAVAKFEGLPGMTPFVLSYIIQHGLGGHSIPIDYSAMVVMLVTGIASQNEAAGGRVPGLERAIPKNKGVEFSQLLHQPAVALSIDPADKKARTFLESVAKGSSAALDEWLDSKAAAKERVAARKAEERETAKQEAIQAEEEAKTVEAAPKPVVKKSVKKPLTAAEQAVQTAEREARAKKTAARKSAKKSTTDSVAKASAVVDDQGSKSAKSTVTPKSAASSKAPTKKKSSTKTTSASKTTSDAGKKPVSPKKSATGKAGGSAKSPTSKPKTAAAADKKATNRKLTKRKPR